MQQIYRYHVKHGRVREYLEWLAKNDQVIRDDAPEGQTYLGTWLTVQGFGTHGAESRWELDDYAALGSGMGTENFQKLIVEWFDFVDFSRPNETTLMKSESDVFVPEGA